jgi:hypothetical protein
MSLGVIAHERPHPLRHPPHIRWTVPESVRFVVDVHVFERVETRGLPDIRVVVQPEVIRQVFDARMVEDFVGEERAHVVVG